MQAEGLNATQFASEIGIKTPTLSHILSGRNNPSLDVLKNPGPVTGQSIQTGLFWASGKCIGIQRNLRR